MNVQLTDYQWIQASLSVQDGGPRLCSACMLAPSACVASSAATLELQNEIMLIHFHQLSDHCVRDALDMWAKSALYSRASPPGQQDPESLGCSNHIGCIQWPRPTDTQWLRDRHSAVSGSFSSPFPSPCRGLASGAAHHCHRSEADR